MNTNQLKNRTQKFAIRMLFFLKEIPNTNPYYSISNQLCRASTSVGANYRAATRAKSLPDFINKLKIVEEECDECMYFMEILMEIDSKYKEPLKELHNEANELLSIFVASINTAKKNLNKS